MKEKQQSQASDWSVAWVGANIGLWFAAIFFIVEFFSGKLPAPFDEMVGMTVFGIVLGASQKYLIRRIFGRKLPYWTLFSGLGAGIGILLAEGFFDIVGTVSHSLTGIAFAVIFAGSIGLAQWLILRGHVVHNTPYWIIATILTGATLAVALENNIVGMFFMLAQAGANWMVISWLFGEWQDEKPVQNTTHSDPL